MQPVNPPRDVTVTASKKGKLKLKASGTLPKTNLTVLNKKTENISHHEFNLNGIIFWSHRPDLLHLPIQEQ